MINCRSLDCVYQIMDQHCIVSPINFIQFIILAYIHFYTPITIDTRQWTQVIKYHRYVSMDPSQVVLMVILYVCNLCILGLVRMRSRYDPDMNPDMNQI